MPATITAVIPARNEEIRIRKCLDSLKGWTDEIIIVDDHSVDRTPNIAQNEFGAKIIIRNLNHDWAGQRNAGAEAAKHDWIIQLDADEIIPPETARLIRQTLENTAGNKAFSLDRVNVLAGRLLNNCGSMETIRVYDRRFAHWQGAVHEKLIFEGAPVRIPALIEHRPVDSMTDFIRKNVLYAELSAEQTLKNGIVPSSGEFRAGLTLKSLKFFWKCYVRRKGYRDGLPGLVWCVLLVIIRQISLIVLWDNAQKCGAFKE